MGCVYQLSPTPALIACQHSGGSLLSGGSLKNHKLVEPKPISSAFHFILLKLVGMLELGVLLQSQNECPPDEWQVVN